MNMGMADMNQQRMMAQAQAGGGMGPPPSAVMSPPGININMNMGMGMGMGTQGGGASHQQSMNQQVIQQLHGVLRNPNHPMMKFMLQTVPGFESMTTNQQMQRLMAARVCFPFYACHDD